MPESRDKSSSVPEMIFQGKYELKTSKEKVWTFIIDPAKISKCLPDLKSLQVEGEDRFVAVVRVGVGLIRADFKFRIEIVGKSPISSVQLKAVGAGSGSSVVIDTVIELKETPEGTELFYSSDAKIGGMVVSLGQRVIKDAAEKTVAGIFECIKQQLE
jgi:carbon monoxide dehydrogenase subunit G